MKGKNRLKVALVYDRVNKWGGAERVLLALHEIFPDAPLYTSVYDSKRAPWARVFPKIQTSFLQRFPLARANHEFFVIFMPIAFRLFDFSDYDLVISVTSEAAKGIRVGEKTKHICYCLTPTRYLWSGFNEYFRNPVLRLAAMPFVYFLRKLDKKMAREPDVMIAISREVQKRIKKYYGRDAALVYPPVDVKKSKHINLERKYYLIVSRLDYGYKKVDLAVRTFNKLGLPLVIVGTGREEKGLKRLAKGNIRFVGKVSEKKIVDYYLHAKALIMPQEEDFGIVSVEAQAHGTPVIAYKKGGALDTVIDGKTGIFFGKQTLESLTQGILQFEKTKFEADNLIRNSQRFSKEKFVKNFVRIINI
jgi:glycosyltransferase involved in cell wall biosynthesis